MAVLFRLRVALVLLAAVSAFVRPVPGPCQGSQSLAGAFSAAQSQDALNRPTFVRRQFGLEQPIRLVAYGDMRFTDPKVTTGTNPRIRQWLVNRIAEEHPQALLLTGDMPFTGEKSADWEEYQRETAAWREQGFPVYPTMGNHEIYHDPKIGIANYLKNYPGIEGHRFYSTLMGPVEVLSLDMNSPVSARSAQGRWFAAQLEHLPPTVQFLLILYHVPWVADTQSQLVANLPSKDSLALRNLLEAHLSRIHARVVVLNGHIHNYERFERHGVEYVVTGGGGAVPYPVLYRGTHDLYRDPGFPVYHYLTLDVKDGLLSATMWKVVDPEAGTLRVEAKDHFELRATTTSIRKESQNQK